MVKPISPKEAAVAKLNNIPIEVIEAVNQLLCEKYSNTRIIITQKDVIERFKKIIIERGQMIPNFEYAWLDFEPLYRQAGWKVRYDRPAWDEEYDAFFEFSKDQRD